MTDQAPTRITCRDFADILDAYLDGELPTEARQPFEWHLKLCRGCTAYLAHYRDTIRLTKQAWRDDDSVPPEVPPQLVQAVLAAMRAGDR